MEINSKARAFLLADKIKQSPTALYFARMLWSGQKDVAGSMVKKMKTLPVVASTIGESSWFLSAFVCGRRRNSEGRQTNRKQTQSY